MLQSPIEKAGASFSSGLFIFTKASLKIAVLGNFQHRLRRKRSHFQRADLNFFFINTDKEANGENHDKLQNFRHNS